MMELYIETLTGAAFELRVSPYETIQNVKARIQKLEGELSKLTHFLLTLKNHSASKRACLGRSSVGQQ